MGFRPTWGKLLAGRTVVYHNLSAACTFTFTNINKRLPCYHKEAGDEIEIDIN